MHAVRNQPQGIIEMPGQQICSSGQRITDSDQTLEMTLQRLAQGSQDNPLGVLDQAFERLPQPSLSTTITDLEMIFTDTVGLEHELSQEMAALLKRLPQR